MLSPSHVHACPPRCLPSSQPKQDLPADLSAEQAQGPGCAQLVQGMCTLFERLKQLSHLELGGELEAGGMV